MKPSALTERGFTLLELSIVLVLIGTIVGMGLVTLTASVQATQFNNTVSRMDSIEKALLNFAIANTRIPCPSDLTQTPSSSTYGFEAGAGTGSTIVAGTGVCTGTGMLPQANYLASGVAEGGVPTRALALTDDYMYDGWGRRFRYAATQTYTLTGALPAAANVQSCSATITVNDSTGAARTTYGVYALISHGANGHGAYTGNGVMLNAGSVNANEQTNCHCNSSAVSTGYSPTYVERVPTLDPSNTLDNFDDIMTFKEAWQMQAQNFPLATTAATVASNLYIADASSDVVRMVNLFSGIITTVAGNGTSGYSGDGGPATAAELSAAGNGIGGVAADSFGNLYIGDPGNYRIRKVSASGVITTVAGNGTYGYSGDGGAATSAQITGPDGGAIAVDNSGNLYIADYYAYAIRKVTVATGIITTVAGGHGYGYSGDGGQATAAQIGYPMGVAVDSFDNIYIGDAYVQRVRKVTAATGIITTVAGNGTQGYSGNGGAATAAELNYPEGVAVDSSGNIYIADIDNNVVRKVNYCGIISTIAGNNTAGHGCTITGGEAATSFALYQPGGVAVDSSGNVYIGNTQNYCVPRINSSGSITDVAGNGTSGYTGDSGLATSAEIKYSLGIALGR